MLGTAATLCCYFIKYCHGQLSLMELDYHTGCSQGNINTASLWCFCKTELTSLYQNFIGSNQRQINYTVIYPSIYHRLIEIFLLHFFFIWDDLILIILLPESSTLKSFFNPYKQYLYTIVDFKNCYFILSSKTCIIPLPGNRSELQPCFHKFQFCIWGNQGGGHIEM